jgi:hypothetical protein
MGRTIPSFRQLLEIERLSWSRFKKELPTKLDKKAFDTIFENAELYASYLSNAVNPIPLECVIIGSLFHNYKTLLAIDKKKENEGDIFCNDIARENELKLTLLNDNKPHGKRLFDRTCEKWQGLLDSLHKEDRETLLKMILEACCSYDEPCNQMIHEKDSESCITYLFFMSLIIQQQKMINRIGKDENADSELKSIRGTTLLDFMR